jgi:hypothetical protein
MLQTFAQLVAQSTHPWLAWFALAVLVVGCRWPQVRPDGDRVFLRDRLALVLVFAAPLSMLFWSAAFYGADHGRRDQFLTWRSSVLLMLGIVHLLFITRVLFIHRRWPFVAVPLSVVGLLWGDVHARN